MVKEAGNEYNAFTILKRRAGNNECEGKSKRTKIMKKKIPPSTC
jgi:hypothetical protein